LIHSIHHAFTGVRSKLHYSGIHANRIFRACFNAKAAKNTDSQIDIEAPGHFFDIWIRVFGCDYMDAARRAYRFAHHAGDASRGAVIAPRKAVAGSQSSGKVAAFFRIFNGNGISLADFAAKSADDVAREIHEKVSGRKDQAAHHFDDIETLDKTKGPLIHMQG
jgi:hypothetical protein